MWNASRRMRMELFNCHSFSCNSSNSRYLCCLTDDAKAYEPQIVILWWGFVCLSRKQTGGGFAEKWLQIKCVFNETTILCYIFYELSHQ